MSRGETMAAYKAVFFCAPSVLPLHALLLIFLLNKLNAAPWLKNCTSSDVLLSFKEQHPNKCAKVMTNSLLWSVDSLMPRPLDRTHISSYEKAALKLWGTTFLERTPVKRRAAYVCPPTCKAPSTESQCPIQIACDSPFSTPTHFHAFNEQKHLIRCKCIAHVGTSPTSSSWYLERQRSVWWGTQYVG